MPFGTLHKPFAGPTAGSRTATGGGTPVTFAGFTIEIAHTNWVGVYEIEMTDHDDNEFFDALTMENESTSYDSYSECPNDGACTNSPYGASTSPQNVTDGAPDITDPNSSPGGVQWSENASSGIEFYCKPTTTNRSIKYLDLALDTSYGDPISSVTLYEGDKATTLNPSDSPADKNDVHQTTSGSVSWYRWTYPADPT